MPSQAAQKIWPDNFNYFLSTAVIVCQEYPVMVNYIYLLLIDINVYFCILLNAVR